MALTDDEKKMTRGYNIGYMLSTYEPRILAEVIRRNRENEFVKAMQVGRDHQEFHANIPRNDYTREFKNGFYNGRTLAEHSPELIDRLMTTKGLAKDYKRGLESAQKEHTVRAIQKKMNRVPKAPPGELGKDETFQKGFNAGYRLSEGYGPALNYAHSTNKAYSKFVDGIKAGKEQYHYDLAALREKDPNARIFAADPQHSKYENAVVEHKVITLNDISNEQLRAIERDKGFDNLPLPKRLQDKTPSKGINNPDKDKDKDIDLDR